MERTLLQAEDQYKVQWRGDRYVGNRVDETKVTTRSNQHSRAEMYAIELQKKLNKSQSTSGLTIQRWLKFHLTIDQQHTPLNPIPISTLSTTDPQYKSTKSLTKSRSWYEYGSNSISTKSW